MFSELKKKLRICIDNLLSEADNYFLCCLPEDIGFFASYILNLFYRGIKTDKEETEDLKRLSERGIVVYAIKYKNFFEYLFLYTRYKKEGLPVPTLFFGFNIYLWQPVSRILRVFLATIHYSCKNFSFKNRYKSGYIKESLLTGKLGLLHLIEKKGFYKKFVKKRTCPVEYLIEMQKDIDRPIYIVPHLTFFSKDPHKSHYRIIDALFGPEENPGIIRRTITLFKNPGKIFVETSTPFDIKEFLDKPDNAERRVEDIAYDIKTILIKQINRHRQGVAGPLIKSYEEVRHNILTKKSLMNYMQRHSKEGKEPLAQIYKKAAGYFDEIAANHKFALIRLAMPLLRLILRLMFEDLKIDPQEIARLKEMSKKGPLIFVPCHRSHIDYMMLYLTIYTNRLYLPHIAAGKNMSFWPFGFIFRRGGAFFIRRTFKGALLYSKVFEEYVYNILEEGGNIEVFIEGTRSRTGKLLRPKLGFMNTLLNAYGKGACDDLIFAPIFIGYQRVLEAKEYIKEVEGAEKSPETIKQVIRARKFLRKRQGKIYMKFAEPISLNDFLSEYNSDIKDMNPKERNTLCKTLSYRILNSIDNSSVITYHALVAAALLNHSKEVISYGSINGYITSYLNYLNLFDVNFSDRLSGEYESNIKETLLSYEHRKLIENISEKDDPEYKVNIEKRQEIDYYRNNCTYFFVPAAYTSLAILTRERFGFSSADLYETYLFLKEFFKNEFTYDQHKEPEYFIEKTIKAFMIEEIITPSHYEEGGYELSSSGIIKLKHYASFLKKFFESYFIVLAFLKKYKKQQYGSKVLSKKIQALGNKMYKTKEIEMIEALSIVNYKNALDYFAYHGIRGKADLEKISPYEKKIMEFLEAFNK